MKSITLRDYQQRAVDDLRAAYRSGARRPLFVLPTGGGKTFVFSWITGQAVARGGRVLILVHRAELLSQASASLTALGITHGCVSPRHPWQPIHPVQVASVQTLVRRFKRFASAQWAPTLIVVDEAHHATAGSWRRVLEHWPDARALGVTATPVRMDGAGLSGAFDRLVEGPQIADLIDAGHLVETRVYAPPMVADLSGVRTSRGDFARGQAAERMDRPTITGDAVTHYARICPGQPAIAFCVSVAHAEHVAAQFSSAGWRAASLDGSMDDATRRRRIADLGAGRLQVLTSCDIISEGTDIPVVSAAILLRPTQSLGLYLQQVGRVLRTAPGKPHAYVIDHAGNVQRHGLPDDPREWTLDGSRTRGKRADDTGPPPPATCGTCFGQVRVIPRRPVACPICGTPLPTGPDRLETLQHDESGELKRVTEADRRALQRARKREEADARTLDDLIRLGKSRGYSPGWAHHRWRARRARG
jgi:superfamily II DNA or RNA helicase